MLLTAFFMASSTGYGQTGTYINQDFDTWTSTAPVAPIEPSTTGGGTWTQTDFSNGYGTSGSTTLYWEKTVGTVGGSSWTPTYSSTNAPLVSSASGLNAAGFQDGNVRQDVQKLLASPLITNVATSGYSGPLVLSFLFYHPGTSLGTMTVTVSSDGGKTWNDLNTYSSNAVSAVGSFVPCKIVIPDAYRSDKMMVGFRPKSSWGSYNMFLDKVVLAEGTAPTTYTATGGTGGYRWSEACTWDAGVVPPAGANIVIPDGTTVIYDMTMAYVGNLTIQGTGALNFNASAGRSLNVSGTLTLQSGSKFNLNPVSAPAVSASGACTTAAVASTTASACSLYINNIVNAGTISSGGTNAQTFYVTGNIDNTGGSFDLSANTSTSSFLLYWASSPKTIIGNTLTLRGLTLRSSANSTTAAGGSITSSANIVVAGATASTLTDGILTMANNSLLSYSNTSVTTITANSNSPATSWINGRLSLTTTTTSGSKTFPLGDASNQGTVSFANIKVASGTGTMEVSPVTVPTTGLNGSNVATPITQVFGTRAYKVVSSAAPFGNGASPSTVTLNGNASDRAAMGGTAAQLRLVQSTASGTGTVAPSSGWANIGSSSAAPTFSATSVAVTSSSTFNTPAGALLSTTSPVYLGFGTIATDNASITGLVADNSIAANQAAVTPGTSNANVMKIAITTGSGTLGSYILTGINVSAASGMLDADVSNVKVWTGTTSAPATQVSSGTFTFSSGVASVTGLNIAVPNTSTTTYVWITYDVSTLATGTTIGAVLAPGALTFTSAYGAAAAGTQPGTTQTATARSVVQPASLKSQTLVRVSTATVTPGTNDNQILCLKLNMNTGGTVYLKTLTFNTSTTSTPASDITSAKVYYTTTNTFSNATQFGSTVTSPSGAFSVTASSFALASANATDTNYFWLVYNVPTGAPTFDLLNATYVSNQILTGAVTGTNTYSGSQPSGYRQVYKALSGTVTETFESAAANGWVIDATGSSTYPWIYATTMTSSPSASGQAGSGTKFATINTFNSSAYGDLISPQISTEGRGSSPDSIKFWVYRSTQGGATSYLSEALQVWLSPTSVLNTAVANNLFVVNRQCSLATVAGLTPLYGFAPDVRATGAGWYQYKIKVPTTFVGSGYVIFRAQGNAGYDTGLDEVYIDNFPVAMSYTGTTYTQNSGQVAPGNTTQVMQIQITAAGSTNPMKVTNFTLNTGASTNAAADIANAKLYSTGTSSTFAATTQYGTTYTAPNGSFSFTGTTTLSAGTNYFWLTYDVPSGANNNTPSDIVKAILKSVTLNDQPLTPRIPTLPSDTTIGVSVTEPIKYTSSAVNQLSSGTDVTPGASNVNILQLPVVMSANGSSVNLTKLVVNTKGSTAAATDIASVQVYYTGNTSTFTGPSQSGATLFGSAVSTGLTADSLFFTGTQALKTGTNYFWVTYTTNASAGAYDVLDGQITALTINGIYRTPSVTSPSGYRQIHKTLVAGAVTETFESAAANGWVIDATGSSTYPWHYATVMDQSPSATGQAGSGTKFATMQTYNSTGYGDLISPQISTEGRGSSPDSIKFWVYRSTQGGNTLYLTEALQLWLSPTATLNTSVATNLFVVNRSCSLATVAGLTPLYGFAPDVSSIGAGWYQYKIKVPTTFVGSGYVIFRAQGNAGYDTGLDEVYIDNYPVEMAYTSSTATQVTGPVVPGTTNASVLQIPVVVSAATGNALSVTNFALSTNGSTDNLIAASGHDITAARIYYTGNTATFTGPSQSGASLFGTAVTTNSGTAPAFNITGSKQLASGTNYFWLVYDVSASAPTGDVIDGEVTSITINDLPFAPRTPTVSAPSGSRLITPPMTYSSADASQLSAGVNVSPGTTGVQILKVNVAMSSTGSPIAFTKMSFNTAPLTAVGDITSARLYYTGANGYSTATQVGTAVTSLSANSVYSFTSTDGISLANGTNNFWLVFDVANGAATYDVLDARLDSVVIAGVKYTATSSPKSLGTTDPAGIRQVYKPIVTGAVTETFETAAADGWVIDATGSSTYPWHYATVMDQSPSATGQAGTGTQFATIQTYNSTGYGDLISPQISTEGRGSSPDSIKFWVYRSTQGGTTSYLTEALQLWLSPTATLNTSVASNLFVVNRSCSLATVAGLTPVYGFAPDVSSIGAGWYQYKVPFPSSYVGTGYVIFRAQGNGGYDTGLDEVYIDNYPVQMVYSATTSSQATAATVPVGLVNAQFLKVKVTVAGGSNPISLTSINLSTVGSTAAADITNAKVYYTGNSSNFAATGLFGTQAAPNGTFTVTGTQALVSGDNYFWVTYDIASGATTGDVVTATVSSIVLNDAPSTPRTPTGVLTSSRTVQAAMTLSNASTVVTRQTSDPVLKGSTGNQVVRLELAMSATGAPLDITGIRFNTTGTTADADIKAANIYYTGNSSTFSTANLFGTVNSPVTNTPVTGQQTLANGTNYFWITYDIQSTATTNNVVNAIVNRVTINGTNTTLTNTTAAGSGRIIVPAYCATALQTVACSTSGTYIKSVSITAPANSPAIGTFSSTTNCPANSTGYSLYFPVAGSTTATLTKGVSYTVSVSASAAGQVIGAWLDADQNGTFDSYEYQQIAASSSATNAATATVAIPTGATSGLTGLRFRIESALSQTDACTSLGAGETEDYFVTIAAQAACTGTPVAGSISGNATICNGFTAALAITGQTQGVSGLTYQWYSSTTQSSGTLPNAVLGGSGGTTAIYTTPSNVSVTTYYQAAVICGANTSRTAVYTLTAAAPAFATLPVAESFENSWTSLCGNSDAPSSNWKNSTVLTGDASWRRNDDATASNTGQWSGSTLNQGTYAPGGSDGTKSARFHSTATNSASSLDLYVNLSSSTQAKLLTFDYINTDGTDNLVVQLSTDGGQSWAVQNTFYTVTEWNTQSVPITSNVANAIIRFTATGSTANTNSSDIGIDNVGIVLSNPCFGQPSIGSISMSPLTASCAVSSYVFNLTGQTTDDNISIKWKKSTNGGISFSTISGATGASISTAITTTSIVRAVITCSVSGMADSTDQQIVIAAPTAGTIPATATFCSGGTVTLSSTGSQTGVSYQWYSSANVDGPFTPVTTGTGGTTTTYTSGVLTATIYYRLQVICGSKTANTNVTTVTQYVTGSPTPATLPYLQDFESWSSACGSRSAPDNHWSTSIISGSYTWEISSAHSFNPTPSSLSGNYSATYYTFGSQLGYQGAMDLALDFSGTGSKQLSFYYINPSGQDNVKIMVSTNGGTQFVTASPSLTVGQSGAWTKQTMVFNNSAYNISNFIIRFLATSDYGDDNMLIDSVYVKLLPSCTGTPSAGTLPASITDCGTSDVSITAAGATSGSGISYQWESSTNSGTGFTPITVTATNGATSTTYLASNHPIITTYYRLKISCGTNVAYSSVPVAVIPLAPEYATVTSSAPYKQTFEDTWINSCSTRDVPSTNFKNTPASGDNSFRREDDGSTAWSFFVSSGAYSPTGSQGSTHSARVHTYHAGNLPTSLDLYINLSNGGNKVVQFDVNGPSGSTFTVLLSTDGGNTFPVTVGTCSTSTTWTTQTMSLAGYSSATSVIRFRANNQTSSSTDMGIDNIVVSVPCAGGVTAGTLPATATYCGTSAVILSATGSSVGSGITYQWYSSTNAAGPFTTKVSGGSGATTTNYTTATSLSGTIYYAMAVKCTITGDSALSNVTAVTAAVTPIYASLPFSESFENWTNRCNTSDVPGTSWLNSPSTGNNSWRREDQGATSSWTVGALSTSTGAFAPTSTQGSHSARFHSNNTSSTGTLDLYVNFSGLTTRTLTFDYINTDGTDYLDIQVSTNGTTFTTPSPALHLTTTTGWSSKSLVLSGYNSSTFIVRFKTTGDGAGTSDIGIDNVNIATLPNCSGTVTAGTVAAPAAICNGSTVTLTALGATGNTATSGITYQWQTSTDSVNFTAVTTGTGGTTTAYTSPALSAKAFYRLAVTCVPTGTTAYSSILKATVNPWYLCYYGPGATAPNNTALHSVACASNDNISSVAVSGTTLSNLNTGCTGVDGNAFTRYAPTTASNTGLLYKGQTFSFSVTTARSGQYAAVWIDYNQNGIFEASEYTGIAAGNTLANQASTASITIPASAASGLTGIRFRSSTATIGNSSASTLLGSGETEDYVVSIDTLPRCPAVTGLTASNVLSTSATLTWTAAANVSGGYDIRYRQVGSSAWLNGPHVVTGVTANLTGLSGGTSGITYEAQVRTNCTGGQFAYSISTTFTTIPAFDEPSGALPITITPGKGCSYVSYSNATATSGSQGNISCLSTPSSWSHDVWFVTTVPASGIVAIDIRSSLTLAVQLLNSGTYTAVTSGSGSNCSNATVPYIYRSGLAPGTTVYIRVSRQGSTNAGGAFTMCVTDGLYWIGGTSTAWGTPGNWMGNTVPSGSANPLIPSGITNLPVISGSSPANNLVVASGSVLTVNGILSVSGSVTNNGTIKGTGTLLFNGTGTQNLTTVSTLNLANITQAGTGTVVQSGPISITGTLAVNSGTYDMNNQLFTLVSNAAGTARVAKASTAIANATNVAVQRYVPLTNATSAGTYEFLGSSLTGKTVGSYQRAGIQTTGFPGATTPSGNPSAWFFNPFDNNVTNKGWVSATDSANTVAPGKGLRLWLPGSFVNGAGGVNNPLSLKGTIQQGAVTANLQYCATGCATGVPNGYNLVGNPYPSEIDWDLIPSSDRPNVDNATWIYRHVAQNYATYASGVGINGGSSGLASSQGFLVRASATGASITFREDAKTANAPSLLRTAADKQLIRVTLGGAGYTDETVVRLHDAATTGYDSRLDAGKLMGAGLNLFTLNSAAEAMGINAIPVPAQTETIPMGITAATGFYTLTFSDLESLPSGITVYLKDNYAHSTTPVSDGEVIAFSVNGDPQSSGNGRFALVFAPSAVTGLQSSLNKAAFSLYPNPLSGKDVTVSFAGFDKDAVRISVQDVLGKEVFTTTLQGNKGSLNTKQVEMDLAPGMYTVIATTGDVRVAQKLIVNK